VGKRERVWGWAAGDEGVRLLAGTFQPGVPASTSGAVSREGQNSRPCPVRAVLFAGAQAGAAIRGTSPPHLQHAVVDGRLRGQPLDAQQHLLQAFGAAVARPPAAALPTPAPRAAAAATASVVGCSTGAPARRRELRELLQGWAARSASAATRHTRLARPAVPAGQACSSLAAPCAHLWP
jgi:hypothetical protein